MAPHNTYHDHDHDHDFQPYDPSPSLPSPQSTLETSLDTTHTSLADTAGLLASTLVFIASESAYRREKGEPDMPLRTPTTTYEQEIRNYLEEMVQRAGMLGRIRASVERERDMGVLTVDRVSVWQGEVERLKRGEVLPRADMLGRVLAGIEREREVGVLTGEGVEGEEREESVRDTE